MSIWDIFRFTFINRTVNNNDVLPIESLEVSKSSKTKRKPRKDQGKSTKATHKELAKPSKVADNVILNANRLLGIILLLSFLAIVIFAIVGKTDQLPSVVSYTFSSTLGYFGGIIVNYMDKVTGKK